uniref:Uncharacterized protein n=2 Tax=Acidianus brierleyi TaxID=41673 RepID=A0A2U9IHY4_9CREN
MLIAGILILIISIMNFMIGYIVVWLTKFFGDNAHGFFLSIIYTDLTISVIYIILFSMLLLVTLIGGIIGIIGNFTYLILSLYYYSVYSSSILTNGIDFHLSFMESTLNLIAFIIIFIKILTINKLASIIGFVGVMLRIISDFMAYFFLVNVIHVSSSMMSFINTLLCVLIFGDILYGVGLILGINIANNVIFLSTGEAKLKFYSQVQGSVKNIMLNGIYQAVTFPSYIMLGINSMELKFPKVNVNENFVTVALDNGSSINIQLKSISNK